MYQVHRKQKRGAGVGVGGGEWGDFIELGLQAGETAWTKAGRDERA